MTLYELCRAAEIPIADGVGDVIVGGIKTDSRRVDSGDIFLCIRGLTFDGHQYIKDAVARGAAAVVVDRSYGDAFCGVPIVTVDDTRHAAAMLYDAWYGNPSRKLKLVAVTGTEKRR